MARIRGVHPDQLSIGRDRFQRCKGLPRTIFADGRIHLIHKHDHRPNKRDGRGNKHNCAPIE